MSSLALNKGLYIRILACLLAASFSLGCVFKLPTVQGNVLEQEDIDELEVGMTSNQVRFVLGTPLLEDPFDPRRWDYVYYYRSPDGEVYQRNVSLYFEGETLASIEGQASPDAEEITEDLVEGAEKDAKENIPAERPDRNKPAGFEEDPFEGSDPNVDRSPNAV